MPRGFGLRDFTAGLQFRFEVDGLRLLQGAVVTGLSTVGL